MPISHITYAALCLVTALLASQKNFDKCALKVSIQIYLFITYMGIVGVLKVQLYIEG